MSKDKKSDNDNKVISIVDGLPLSEKPKIDPEVEACIKNLEKELIAGNISQIVVVTINDSLAITTDYIAGRSNYPENVFTSLELLKDDYKDLELRGGMVVTLDEIDE